ncbi:MAG: TIGR01777 family protein, partial [Nitrospina sp.]|nr:TIGR01777 family protein [Nitrospina sp.]
MKILIAGATGFIGKELIKKLDGKGHEIVVLTRNSETARFHIPIHCEIQQWDPENNPLSTNSLKDIDAVINLSGENIASSFWTDTQKRKLMDSRIMSVRRIVQAMEVMNTKPSVFISASAVGFYGNRKNEELQETSSAGEGFLSKVCQSWENEITESKKIGIRTVIFRLGMVLGHDGGALEKIMPAFKLGLGGKLGDGSQWMSWIHINDFADMIVYAIENPKINGIINAVSPNPVKNIEFTKTLGRMVKRPTILPVPGIALRVALR